MQATALLQLVAIHRMQILYRLMLFSNYIAGLPAAGKREKVIVSLFHLPHHPALQTTMKIN